jgi:LysR family hydrogen peroxide-inducible transcriptional activator
LYFEPFVAYIPENHRDFHKEEIEVADLNLTKSSLLQDDICYGILNLCKTIRQMNLAILKSKGSFETLIKLADEGLGTNPSSICTH